MKIVDKNVTVEELKKMSENMYDNLVKAVVDVEKKIMVVDADMHADEEQLLLEAGSHQNNLWGINLHPYQYGEDDWIEFDSMINIRPSWGNKTRGVDDIEIQKKIIAIVDALVVT